MQRGQTLVYILVGVLILISVAGGAYYLARQTTPKSQASVVISQTPQSAPSSVNETVDWKTYTNTVYGYSISYPSDWSVITGLNCQLNTSMATVQDSLICLTPHPLPLTADQATGKDFQGAIDAQNKIQTIEIRIYIKPVGISSHDYFKQYVVTPAQRNGWTVPGETTALVKKSNPDLDITTDEVAINDQETPTSPNAYVTRGSQDAILMVLTAHKVDTQLAYKIFSTFKYTDNNPVTLGNEDFTTIQQALAGNNNLLLKKLSTTVNKAPAVYNGLFATGDDFEVGAAGGGKWTAVKVNGQWKIVYAGNGGPLESDCQKIKQYNLPKDLNPCN